MPHITVCLPILLYVFSMLSQSPWVNKYTDRCFTRLGCNNPLQLLMTMMVIHIVGLEYLSYYYGPTASMCKEMMAPLCNLYSLQQLRSMLGAISTSMITWKVLLLQRRLIAEHGSLLPDKFGFITINLDWTTAPSFSEQREGANVGYNSRYKGKPCFQILLSQIGQFFVDMKLCSGDSNPSVHFCKMLKRAISMGYQFTGIRADAAFGCAENVLFILQLKLSLYYAIGASSRLAVIKEGRKLFRKLVHQGSSRIIHIAKGLAALDLGQVNIAAKGKSPVYARVIICRRIHRKKKDGRWKVREYYYAVLTNLPWTVLKVVRYYHQRQEIENGIKELKYHYSLVRMPHQTLKANEFYIATKLLAMTMVKLFQLQCLPNALRSLRRKTLLLQVLDSAIVKVEFRSYLFYPIKVDIRTKSKYSWHLQRILKKLLQDHPRLCALKMAS